MSTERFSGDDQGRVKKLHAVNVEIASRNGKLEIKPVPGSAFELDADLVLLAMGFLGPERGGMLDELGVKITERGNVWRDDELDDERPGRLHRRRHAARPVADRVGDRRGPQRRPRRRHVPDGQLGAAGAPAIAFKPGRDLARLQSRPAAIQRGRSDASTRATASAEALREGGRLVPYTNRMEGALQPWARRKSLEMGLKTSSRTKMSRSSTLTVRSR